MNIMATFIAIPIFGCLYFIIARAILRKTSTYSSFADGLVSSLIRHGNSETVARKKICVWYKVTAAFALLNVLADVYLGSGAEPAVAGIVVFLLLDWFSIKTNTQA